MTDDDYQLDAYVFRLEDRPRFVDFYCGDEVWCRLASEWIRGDEVAKSITDRRTEVWYFEDQNGRLVGFGSLGPSRRRWPPPAGDFANLMLVPMLAVAAEFQGYPPAGIGHRYADQIMSHVLGEALSRRPGSRVVLLVDPRNERAVEFYRRWGFEMHAEVARDGQRLMHIALPDA